jgi:hypothetical protein
MSQALFPLLTGAPWKQYDLIREGTHTVLMEKKPAATVQRRTKLPSATRATLSESCLRLHKSPGGSHSAKRMLVQMRRQRERSIICTFAL